MRHGVLTRCIALRDKRDKQRPVQFGDCV